MSTLYDRATPSQSRILRAVEGAVKNVAHYHPEWKLNARVGRSIAKRAAGTLTAGWPDVLAASSRQNEKRSQPARIASHESDRQQDPAALARGGHNSVMASPHLLRFLSSHAGRARREGDQARLDMIIEMLREVSLPQVAGDAVAVIGASADLHDGEQGLI